MPPITELAILRLPPSSHSTISPTLLHNLTLAKSSMESISHHPFSILHCHEDPSVIYILGSWPSISFHTEVWLPSQENQELLELLDGQVIVESMFHVEIEGGLMIDGDVGGVVVGRWFVEGGKGRKGEVERVWREMREEDGMGGMGVGVGGWRVEREEGEEGREEFVVVMGWESRGMEMGEVGKGKGWEGDERIREVVDRVEVLHFTKLV